MLRIAFALTFLGAALTAQFAHAQTLKQRVRADLAPHKGFLPSPTSVGFRRVAIAKLPAPLIAKAKSLKAQSDMFSAYQKRYGVTTAIVFDSAFEGTTNRWVYNGAGRSLQ